MKIAVYGYGNLGKGVLSAAMQNPDVEVVGIFTRRDPTTLSNAYGIPFYSADRVLDFAERADVMILCGGSATDLPEMTPALAKHFNVVDSFDTHARIPEHFSRVDAAASAAGKVALISAGWDPGLFSLLRTISGAVLPDGADYTFWGKGVSQGHSDAIRRIEGVEDARQYTVPVQSALDAVLSGECPELTAREKHRRECFVVAKAGADTELIRKEICEMPNYFADYDTTVTFISREEMQRDHSELPHGGFVIRNGKTGKDGQHNETVSFSLKLDSNPEFTSSVLVAYARAVYRMSLRGARGCKTVLDVAPADLSPLSPDELRKKLL